MSNSALSRDEVQKIRKVLYDAKFALEQELSGEERDRLIERINQVLDLTVKHA